MKELFKSLLWYIAICRHLNVDMSLAQIFN